MTANAKTSIKGNYLITAGRNVTAVVAAGALALGLSGCDSGKSNSETVNPVPSASQIDKPTTDPTNQNTGDQTDNGNIDPSQLKCVGDKFLKLNENGVEIVDDQRAFDCVKDAGQVEVTSGIGGDIDWTRFYGKSKTNKDEYIFRISNDWRNPDTFGVLVADYLFK